MHRNIAAVLIFFALSMAPVSAFPDTCLDIRSEVPYGIRSGNGLIVRGATISSLFVVESFCQQIFNVNVEVVLPESFEPRHLPHDLTIDEKKHTLKSQFRLVTEYDQWFRLIDIYVPPDIEPGLYTIKMIATFDQSRIEKKISLRVVTPEEASDLIEIENVDIPSDVEGEVQTRYESNTIISPQDRGILGRLLFQESNSHIAATHARLELRNQFNEDIIVHVSFDILNKADRKSVEWLRLPHCDKEVTAVGKGEIYTQTLVKGNGITVVTLPITIDNYTAIAGDYLSRTKAAIFGSDSVVDMVESDLKIVTRNYTSLFVTALSVVITFLWFFVAWAKRERIFRGFKTRYLVLAGLFGTTTFAVSTVPATIIGNIVHIFLGPFSFLVTGIFNEMVLYMLIVSLVVLIPRIGIISMVTMMRFLLAGIMFGHFSLPSFLWYASTGFILELALYLFKLISIDGKNNLLNSSSVFLRSALSCGLADAFISFIFLNVSMTLYRLYYANWYIIMYVTISGFLYTAMAAPLGVMLGNKLKKTAFE